MSTVGWNDLVCSIMPEKRGLKGPCDTSKPYCPICMQNVDVTKAHKLWLTSDYDDYCGEVVEYETEWPIYIGRGCWKYYIELKEMNS